MARINPARDGSPVFGIVPGTGASTMITKSKAIEAAIGEVKKMETVTHDHAVEGLKQGAATAAAGLEQAQVNMKDGMQRVMKTAEQMTSFSQGNMEALMKSGQILSTGLTDLSKLMAETARANLDETMATFRAMTSAKSVKEAIELQTSFARSSVEKAMSESSRLTEHSLKLAEQAIAPLTARVNAAVETFSA
jgi:phasin family protein